MSDDALWHDIEAALDEELVLINKERIARGLPPGGPITLCQLCLHPSSRSICPICESTGGLFDDWRSDCDG